MSNPMIRIHNSETDEVIDREMTPAEFEVYQKQEKAKAQADADKAAKAADKAALLERLGITAEEATLLLG
jgi:hypothetical protein